MLQVDGSHSTSCCKMQLFLQRLTFWLTESFAHFPLNTMIVISTPPMVSFLLNVTCTRGGSLTGNPEYSAVAFNSLGGLTPSGNPSQWLAGSILLTRSSGTSHDHGN